MKLCLTLLFCLFSQSLWSQAWKNRKPQLLHTETRWHSLKTWTDLGKTEEQAVVALVEILSRSETGMKVLQEAKQKASESGQTLSDVITAAEGSLTDTTLIRRFSPEAPDQVMYETRSKVTVNRNLRVREALLDLAHELTHFTYRTPFNPYTQHFTLKSFVESTVEGQGGEVEAFMVECQVYFELFPHEKDPDHQCRQVIDKKSGEISKRLGIEHFYRVGAYHKKFADELKTFELKPEDLPLLSEHDPLFISSAWGLPYPIAAFREFVTIMGRACENDLRRLELLKSSSLRAPASLELTNRYQKMNNDYESRCQSFRSDLHSQNIF